MSNATQDYEEMRLALKDNIAIIRGLVKQADSYRKLISSVEDENAHKNFEKNLGDIYKTIDSLIKQTEYMFYQYTKLAESKAELRDK